MTVVTVSEVSTSDGIRGITSSRRAFLQSAVALAAGATAISVVAACGSDGTTSAEQRLADRLLPQVTAANTDAAAARAAIAGNPDRAAALTVIAEERTVHSVALTDEITRLDSGRAEIASSSATPSPAVTSSPTIDELRTQLTASANSAGSLAIELDGYVAGLLGSISAGTTTLAAVQLS